MHKSGEKSFNMLISLLERIFLVFFKEPVIPHLYSNTICFSASLERKNSWLSISLVDREFILKKGPIYLKIFTS
jgi:hypothetical protein